MEIKIIENTNKKIFEEKVNLIIQCVRKVINIQYCQTSLGNNILRTAMIIYEAPTDTTIRKAIRLYE